MSVSFGSLLQGYFAEHLAVHKRSSPETIDSYRDTFCVLLRFIEKTQGIMPSELRTADLDAPVILQFLDYLERDRHNSIRSRNVRLAAIRSFFRYTALRDPESVAVATRILAIPVKRSERKLIGYLTRPEIQALLAAPNRSTWSGRRDHALLATIYNTGARVSEMTSLRQSDITIGSTSLVQLHGKGRKERVIPLWAATARTLRAWFREVADVPGGVVFPNARNGVLSSDGVSYILWKAFGTASVGCPSLRNKRVTPHVLRHTTAMHLLQSGVSLAVIALWLGHESIETTHMYVEADTTSKEQALQKLAPASASRRRFKATDSLMEFLSAL